jgi:glycosyltransferase involved in cell wall biosynthesis
MAIRVLTINREPVQVGGHQGGDEVQRIQLSANCDTDIVIEHNRTCKDWRQRKYDIVHVFNIILWETVVDAYKFAESIGAKLVISCITPVVSQLPVAVIPPLKYASALIVQCTEEVELMAKGYKIPETELQAKAFYVPAGAPANWYLQGRMEGTPSDTPYALCSARFENRKSQVPYLRMLIKLGWNNPFYLIGDERNEVYTECVELSKLHPWIKPLGRVPHDQMLSMYAGAAVHVLPTHHDNPGLSNLEAGIVGCELVTSDIPSIREYLRGHAYYGIPGFPITYAEKTVLAWKEALAYGKNTVLANHIKDNYTWDIAGHKLSKVYRSVM